MVAGQEDVRNRHASKDGRPGVLGMVEKAVFKGLDGRGVRVPDDAWDQAGDRVDDDHGSDLAAGENVVANGDSIARRGPRGYARRSLRSGRRSSMRRGARASSRAMGWAKGRPWGLRMICPAGWCGGSVRGLGRGEDGAGHHGHARAAAIGPIIDLAVLVVGVVADIPEMDIDKALLAGEAQGSRRGIPGRCRETRLECQFSWLTAMPVASGHTKSQLRNPNRQINLKAQSPIRRMDFLGICGLELAASTAFQAVGFFFRRGRRGSSA